MAAVSPRREYYEVLEVARTASDAELKRAFRRLALKWHPDQNPGDVAAEERFKEVGEAYAVLSDGDKRAAYDRMGHAAFERGGQGFPGVGEVVETILSEILGRRPKRAAGRDLRYTLELTLGEAARGVERTIRFPTRKDCPTCKGSGARRGAGLATCPACHGRGEVGGGRGIIGGGRPCATCDGVGKLVADPCERCEGAGQIRIEREFTVTIPPGVDDGSSRRIPGEGEPGRRGGTPGDLHVILRVKEHPVLARKGRHVEGEVPVSITLAALGGQIEVPTLDGPIRMRVPAGTQSGRVFRLRGKGVGEGGERGDQLVRVVVETPTSLSARQRELLDELGRATGEEAGHPRRRRFLDTLKDLFGADE